MRLSGVTNDGSDNPAQTVFIKANEQPQHAQNLNNKTSITMKFMQFKSQKPLSTCMQLHRPLEKRRDNSTNDTIDSESSRHIEIEHEIEFSIRLR